MNKIAVFGLGISGISTINFLTKNNKKVIAIDDNQASLEAFQEKHQDSKDIFVCFDKNQINWSEVECLILSPGVPLTHPKPHKIVVLAKENNCPIIGDTELFYLYHQNRNFIGITGTNGKSTTTSLTGHIFAQNNISSAIGGNIGIPCLDLEDRENYIFEISSFQLDLSQETRFHIAAITNITPDHLDRHGNMEGYVKAKKRVFLNQTPEDFALFNIDDETCLKLYQELKADPAFKSKIVAISTKTSQKDSISLINNQIINNISQKTIDIPDFSNLKGNHNKQNLAFAYAIAALSGIDDKKIIDTIPSFKGLKHRLEFIKKVGNISFVNDSKATNVISTLCALEAYDNIFWIAGGKGKNDDLSLINPYLKKIKKAFLIGQDQQKFADFLKEKNIEIHICDILETAFKAATDLAIKEKGEINIILSPACASFDQWKNFEERGDYFCQLANNFN